MSIGIGVFLFSVAGVYEWGEFMDAMIKDIIKENPSPTILRAIARTYKSTKELKKLETIKKLTASASGPS
mgnify:CR=1 FL=1